jgi:hypothetical protein
MPNWSTANIRFSSDNTQDSINAVIDLYNRMRKVQSITFNCILNQWQRSNIKSEQDCEITLYSFYTLGLNIYYNCDFRGNIVKISELCYHDSIVDFEIETMDAWETNVCLFLNIANTIYNNLIKVDFVTGFGKCEEAGECITNSDEFVGKCAVKVYLEGVDNVLKYKELWNYSNPLFVSLINTEGIDNAPGKWIGDMTLDRHFTSQRYIPPLLSYENTIIYDDMNEIPNSLIDINKEYNSSNYYDPGLFCDINTAKYINPKDRFGNKLDEVPKPIYDNFTTFLGGKNNG